LAVAVADRPIPSPANAARLAALVAAAIRAREELRSREYPWCFFPEKTLKSFLLLETG